MAAAGAPHGTVLISDCQTGGRGRLGRSFHSPAGAGIYMSVLLRPKLPPEKLMHLTCAAGVAMCDAVELATNIRPGIKWTNDLVVDCKKLGGILTELGLGADGNVEYAIVGIGINCSQCAADFPAEIRDIATSLLLCTGKTVERAALAAKMIAALEQMAAGLAEPDETLRKYRTDCITVGQEISLVRGDEVLHGTALDVDEAGGLVVRFADGRVQSVTSGEVSVRGMYGYV